MTTPDQQQLAERLRSFADRLQSGGRVVASEQEQALLQKSLASAEAVFPEGPDELARAVVGAVRDYLQRSITPLTKRIEALERNGNGDVHG